VQQEEGEELSDIPSHPFEVLLRRPNPLMSRFELIESTLSYYSLTGNAYWWLSKANENAGPDEIFVIPPHQIRPVPDGRSFIRGYMYVVEDGQEVPLEPWEICHFKMFNPSNPFLGMSPVESIGITASGDLAAQQWGRNFYAENNAKTPGALAFADPISDPEWEKIKADTKAQHGGMKRSMMLLRNAGSSVNWVDMSITQKDMAFLETRQFSKEEIYAVFAPGLTSLLDPNSTEANSKEGKATFLEIGVWPHLVAMAEKITNDILPSYGNNLVAQFDDIRMKDRAVELSEQEAFARTHTIDEVRAEYYGHDPIGDERGELLIAEVGKGLTVAEEEPEEDPRDIDVSAEFAQLQDNLSGEIKALIETSLPPEPQHIVVENPPTEAPTDDPLAARRTDLQAWRRKAVKRFKAGNGVCDFESDHIPESLSDAIKTELSEADTVEGVRAVFDDFFSTHSP
jgi:HK97 family phage portal protein